MGERKEENRAGIRQDMASLRLDMPQQTKCAADQRIADLITSTALWKSCATVFAYMAYRGEPCLERVINTGLLEGKTVALPVCLDDSHMAFFKIESSTEVKTGRYGIAEPLHTDDARIREADGRTLVLLPCLAFDRRGYRLGYGKGYYDRYLSGHKDAETMITAYAFQQVDRIPELEGDISSAWIVTEAGVCRAE